MIDSSEPDTVKEIKPLSVSVSVAVTVPIAVWFSAALNVAPEVNTGGEELVAVSLRK